MLCISFAKKTNAFCPEQPFFKTSPFYSEKIFGVEKIKYPLWFEKIIYRFCNANVVPFHSSKQWNKYYI